MNNTLNLIFSKYGKFSNTIRILIIIQFLISIVNGIISFLLIFYIRALGYSPIIYGIMTSITGLVFLITIVPSGVISSRIGAKGMINLGIISSILSLLILVIFESIPLLIISSVFMGLSWSLSQPSFGSLLATAASPEERNYAFSLNGFSNLIGASLGTAFSGYFPSIGQIIFLNTIFGYKLSFIISIFILVFLTFLVKKIDINLKVEKQEKVKIPSNVKKTLIKLTLPAMLIGFGAGFVIPYFQLQFKFRFGVSIESISYIFALTDFIMAILMLYIPFYAEKKGTLITIVVLWLLATLTLFLMPFISYLPMGFYMFSSLYIIRTILMNVAGPIQS
ncbi:MAG: MFS transporter, partial [Thermoplasmata archaeon]